MTTPAYGLKHWWRAARRPYESLKAFARRHAGWWGTERLTTSGAWLQRKSPTAIARALNEKDQKRLQEAQEAIAREERDRYDDSDDQGFF
jgi:hypothetical protein